MGKPNIEITNVVEKANKPSIDKSKANTKINKPGISIVLNDLGINISKANIKKLDKLNIGTVLKNTSINRVDIKKMDKSSKNIKAKNLNIGNKSLKLLIEKQLVIK